MARFIRLIAPLAILICSAVLPAAAEATFPGKNGKLAAQNRCCPTTDPNFNNWYTSLFTVEPDGSDRTSFGGGTGRGRWSPDGSSLAFLTGILTACSGCHPLYRLYTMNADGSEQRFVTDVLRAGDYKWNPDGSGFFFLRAGKHILSHVFRVNRDGGGLLQLTAGPGVDSELYDESSGHAIPGTFYVDSDFDPSPDGRRVALIRTKISQDATGNQTDLGQDVWVVDARGGSAVQITSDGGTKLSPAWAPDGSEIAYLQTPTCCSTYPQLVKVRPDGSGAAPFAVSEVVSFAGWSPDSRNLLLHRTGGLYVMRRDGSGLLRLAAGESGVWSPDSTEVGFSAAPAGLATTSRIFTIGIDGTGLRQVTSTIQQDRPTDWQAIPGPKRGDYRNGNQFCKSRAGLLGPPVQPALSELRGVREPELRTEPTRGAPFERS